MGVSRGSFRKNMEGRGDSGMLLTLGGTVQRGVLCTCHARGVWGHLDALRSLLRKVAVQQPKCRQFDGIF